MPQYLMGLKGSMYVVLGVLDVVRNHLGFVGVWHVGWGMTHGTILFLVLQNHDPLIAIKCGHVLRNSLDCCIETLKYIKFCTWGARDGTFFLEFYRQCLFATWICNEDISHVYDVPYVWIHMWCSCLCGTATPFKIFSVTYYQ